MSAAEPCRLAPQQEHIWEYLRFLNPADPGSTYLTIAEAVRIHGAMDVAAFRSAFAMVFGRHDILRAALSSLGDSPLLVWPEDVRFEVPFDDLRGLSGAEQRSVLDKAHADLDEASFDLLTGPLVRARVFRVDTEEHVVMIACQHLVMDGWSADLFWRELFWCYRDALAQRPCTLARPMMQYRDFADAQWLRFPEGRRTGSHWADQLGGVPPPLALPTDRPRSGLRSWRYALHEFTFSDDLKTELAAASLRWRVTPFVVVLAAYHTLLFRLTGETDLTTGSVMSTRDDPRAAHMLGLCTNVVFLRARASPGWTFADLVRHLWGVTGSAYRNEAPYSSIAAELWPGFQAARPWPPQAVFQSWFQFDVPARAFDASPFRVARFTRTAKAMLTRVYEITDERQRPLWERENPTFEFDATGSAGVVQYNESLFRPETVAGMTADLQAILRAGLRRPDTAMADLPSAR
ncbi:condensation domain-containing protein [Amycolatopsis sp. NPDC003676]